MALWEIWPRILNCLRALSELIVPKGPRLKTARIPGAEDARFNVSGQQCPLSCFDPGCPIGVTHSIFAADERNLRRCTSSLALQRR
ncbi:hypothetical protein AVEN_176019-1 [Araneus ventricosus]|uniref:Uncharacterized protein n=1 Tax=Araneus ventricosus TaxID=182803 RepID=A0A4Y2SRZ5_ARAVE|nr:hypothetical protein AVEN_176019-1 [Araneus ventricosus]